jgi:hypothetical protein
MYGQGDVKDTSVNQHKGMAGASSTGNFGVKGLPQRPVPHPDVKAGTGSKGMMDDSMRGAPPAIGKHPMAKQAAPDHGSDVMDHFSYSSGKV